jgi:hypothetical protein
MIFIECSAKTNKGIEEVYQEVVEKVIHVADRLVSLIVLDVVPPDYGSASAASEHSTCCCEKGAGNAKRGRGGGGGGVLLSRSRVVMSCTRRLCYSTRRQMPRCIHYPLLVAPTTFAKAHWS